MWGRRSPILLQAFCDDSASDKGDKRLFMAGYLDRADRWQLFSEAWLEELQALPSIAYLRMVEANNLRGQFKGWTKKARDQKLKGLARVIIVFFRKIAEIVVPPSIGWHGGNITSIVVSALAAASTLDYAGHDSASRNYTVTGSVRHPLSQWTAFAYAAQTPALTTRRFLVAFTSAQSPRNGLKYMD